jgi:hypothetical protein
MSLILMQGVALTTGTTSSLAIMLVSEQLQIDFDLTCVGGPSKVEYFIEYSEDLITWFAEVADEDVGRGVTFMPKAVRTLADNNSSAIADNPHFRATCQFVRKAPFARIQMTASQGTVVVNTVMAPFGLGPYGSVQTVAKVGPDCSSGAVQFDVTLVPVQTVLPENGEIAPSDYVFTGATFPAYCTNLRFTVTLDIEQVGGGDNVFVVSIADPGFLDVTDATGDIVDQEISVGIITGAYQTLTPLDDITSQPFTDFVNPGTPKSIYFHAPRVPPGFNGSTFNIKNIHIRITAQ